MKLRLDDKMWRLYGHCFDCQVKFENRLRIEGKFEEWEKETGCPMLLNTSLNIKGEPIINNNTEAKNFEIKTGVKVL